MFSERGLTIKHIVLVMNYVFFAFQDNLELLLDRVNDLIEFRISAILQEISTVPLCSLPEGDPLTCEQFLNMTKV